MPESRLKYLYERLGDHDFQLLTSVLLTYRFPDFIPLPLRQSDGGRDGVIQGGPDKLIYQVKWSVKGTEKKPVDWLNAVVKSESHNLKRLASEGSKRYVLITNVPSTGAPGSGTFDKLNERLDEHAKAFGFEQNVNSVRSLPAQIAVACGAEDFLSATKNGFSEVSDARRRKRQEAIRHLRSSEPALAAAAAERRFRAGQKNSTFPWSNVAAAVYDARGPSWLASCVAIFGAASPLNLGVTKKPGVDAFGPSSHPCALLDQTRAHASDAEWWLDQLAQLHETSPAHDRALSEWALALWCVADPEVFGNHLPVWEDVMSKLPAARRRSVVDAAFRTSAHGWVQPCASPRTSTDATLSFLLEARNPGPRKEVGNGTYVPHERGPELRGLLEVARSDRWFKVDSVGTYR